MAILSQPPKAQQTEYQDIMRSGPDLSALLSEANTVLQELENDDDSEKQCENSLAHPSELAAVPPTAIQDIFNIHYDVPVDFSASVGLSSPQEATNYTPTSYIDAVDSSVNSVVSMKLGTTSELRTQPSDKSISLCHLDSNTSNSRISELYPTYTPSSSYDLIQKYMREEISTNETRSNGLDHNSCTGQQTDTAVAAIRGDLTGPFETTEEPSSLHTSDEIDSDVVCTLPGGPVDDCAPSIEGDFVKSLFTTAVSISSPKTSPFIIVVDHASEPLLPSSPGLTPLPAVVEIPHIRTTPDEHNSLLAEIGTAALSRVSTDPSTSSSLPPSANSELMDFNAGSVLPACSPDIDLVSSITFPSDGLLTESNTNAEILDIPMLLCSSPAPDGLSTEHSDTIALPNIVPVLVTRSESIESAPAIALSTGDGRDSLTVSILTDSPAGAILDVLPLMSSDLEPIEEVSHTTPYGDQLVLIHSFAASADNTTSVTEGNPIACELTTAISHINEIESSFVLAPERFEVVQVLTTPGDPEISAQDKVVVSTVSLCDSLEPLSESSPITLDEIAPSSSLAILEPPVSTSSAMNLDLNTPLSSPLFVLSSASEDAVDLSLDIELALNPTADYTMAGSEYSTVVELALTTDATLDLATGEHDKESTEFNIEQHVLPNSSLPSSQVSCLQPDEKNRSAAYVDEIDTVGDLDDKHIDSVFSAPDVSTLLGDDQDIQPYEHIMEFDTDYLLSSSPVSSSPPLLPSSPNYIFSSSPPPQDLTPPSSPPPIWSKQAGKRSREAEDFASPDRLEHMSYLTPEPQKRTFEATDLHNTLPLDRKDQSDMLTNNMDETPNKRMKLDIPMSPPKPPTPKRPTLASQQRQHKKLTKPFRSPFVGRVGGPSSLHGVYASATLQVKAESEEGKPDLLTLPVDSESKGNGNEVISSQTSSLHATRDRTQNAAKQFKSPLAIAPSIFTEDITGVPAFSHTFSNVKATPTIQALQGKVQLLKQAIKIEQDSSGEDDKLEELVSRWRSAGREVAWEVWGTVKDLDVGDSARVNSGKGWMDDQYGDKKGGKSGWGYDDGKKNDGLQKGWGWDGIGDNDVKMGEEHAVQEGDGKKIEEEESEEEILGHTLGTMLRHMGIDPDTLGWDEDEGDFVGEP